MKTKKYILFLTIVLISLIVVMPFNISAEDNNGTYVVIDTEIEKVISSTQQLNYIKTLSYARMVQFNYGGTYKIYAVTLNSGNKIGWTGSNPDFTPTSNFTATSYGDISYYVYSYSSSTWYFLDVPVIEIQSSPSNSLAYRYTFGDLAVDPTESLNYGLLKTGYSTKFVTTNFEGLNDRNIDTITWEDNDTNGNFIGSIGYEVEIRAIPGYYEASTQAALIAQNVQNFFRGLLVNASGGAIDLEPVQYYTLVKTSANRKEFSITWEEVIDHFPQNWGRYYKQGSLLRNLNNEDLWYKTGWLYEIRYLYNEGEEDEYISDWQTIYQVTAVDPGTSTNIIQNAPQGLTPEMYNLLQTVNTLNNTVQNWNINGVPINMEPQTTPTSDGSWLEYIVNAISTMVGSIVDAIADIVKAILGIGSDIIEGLFNMINDLGVNLISFFRDLIDSLTGADEQIDLTLPQWDPIAEDNGILDEFKALGNGFVNIFINSGLGYMLIIPLIIILLRLVF